MKIRNMVPVKQLSIASYSSSSSIRPRHSLPFKKYRNFPLCPSIPFHLHLHPTNSPRLQWPSISRFFEQWKMKVQNPLYLPTNIVIQISAKRDADAAGCLWHVYSWFIHNPEKSIKLIYCPTCARVSPSATFALLTLVQQPLFLSLAGRH